MIIEHNGILSKKFCEMQNILKPDYAIEVGAHAAEFSMEMANLFSINAVAFEANPYVFQMHHESKNTNLVKYLHYAISNHDGIIKFNIHDPRPNAGNNSIKIRSGDFSLQEHDVKCYKLDTYFKDTEFKNACLWIDAEGANGEVLSGAIETLSRCSSIFIETEDIAFWEEQWLTEDVESFLNQQGFEKIDSEYAYHMQQNIIFIKKGVLNDYKTS